MLLPACLAQLGLIASYRDLCRAASAGDLPPAFSARGYQGRSRHRKSLRPMLMPLRGPRQSHAIGRTVRAPFRPPLHTRPSVEPRQLGRRPQAPHV